MRSSSRRSRVFLAGLPTASERDGRRVPGETRAPAAKKTLVLERGAIEDDAAHADKGPVPDVRAVHDREVTDRDLVADGCDRAPACCVNNGVVLDVRAGSDTNGRDVSTEDRAKPDARIVADLDVSDDDGRFGDVRPCADSWRDAS